MGAPTSTVRTDPTTLSPPAIMLTDGHPAYITIGRYPSIKFQEITLNPPGIDGGAVIEVHTQFNKKWMTKAPRILKTMQEIKGTAAYDPWCWPQIQDAVNVNDQITFWWPDGSNVAFWGTFTKADAKAVEEGKRPEIDFTITPTMRDNAGAEQDPVYTLVSGT